MDEMKLNKISHLCTKSSVFHPTRLKAGGQQEIYRHMKRHYDRLNSVSPATDTSPPQSMLSSTLSRDRVRKQPTVSEFPLPVTSRFMEDQMAEKYHNDLISLPTRDSDIQSVLRHVPELAEMVKFHPRNANEADESVGQAEGINSTLTSKNAATNAASPPRPSNSKSPSNLNNTLDNAASVLDLEGQYLKFVQDITREILISNITSDRALKMLFERHMMANAGKLNEAIMQLKIDELKDKLNIT